MHMVIIFKRELSPSYMFKEISAFSYGESPGNRTPLFGGFGGRWLTLSLVTNTRVFVELFTAVIRPEKKTL